MECKLPCYLIVNNLAIYHLDNTSMTTWASELT